MSEFTVTGTTGADGCWTRHDVKRKTHNRGDISFDPDVIAGSPFSVRLRSTRTGKVFSHEVSWTAGDTGRKTIATDVLAGTEFTIDSRGSQGQTQFSGKLFTA
jgi:hypothetical protein